MNKDKLVAYLQTFHDDRDDAQFVEEKQLIIDTLRALEYEDAAAEKKATVAEA